MEFNYCFLWNHLILAVGMTVTIVLIVTRILK